MIDMMYVRDGEDVMEAAKSVCPKAAGDGFVCWRRFVYGVSRGDNWTKERATRLFLVICWTE